MELLALKQRISAIEFDNKVWNPLHFRRFSDCENRIYDLLNHLKELRQIKHLVLLYQTKYMKNSKKTKTIVKSCVDLEFDLTVNLHIIGAIQNNPFMSMISSSDSDSDDD